ncbi:MULTISPECIES: histidine phosphatase family protein [unclassified Undibacterium]|uniref:histidine phosphatase family protein n=1 Tax=unclassified Undibacterium TaxID=2630295 RepID=UPI002AC8C783|nr:MULTISPECIES: histidine phosphatase family protein [unclassified Undibacterium]MEB0138242.1 histidine phosphatase family protein [Undibacterium sp. CCC2.1]MEB0171597.1 histidine phosphatase family protein [Undibacterium sp. CCC1.1]MEB0175483.1 histidine phosphatase family protein [Undibacterium sp. CCC3.4]MEB0214797.1 histidine phosphatase family protein [Undibacterium sp. 5I2]WPX45284.1 histidine phosphatase family protein [Undibacterium sp. CCC3.4]
MTDILLIRHGETAWNAVRRLQGHLDIPLNAVGTSQAKALAAALQTEKLAAIISSDLQRAIQTAGEIARLQGISTRLDAGLRERCFGGFEGQLYSDLPQLFPHEYAAWKTQDPDAEFPPGENAGESTRRFHARVISHIQHYARQFAGQKIAIVAHGGVLECAYRAAHRLPLDAPREVTIYNASINRFSCDDNGELHLLSWGDIAHLSRADTIDEIA